MAMTHPPMKAAPIADDPTGANNIAALSAKRGIAALSSRPPRRNAADSIEGENDSKTTF